MQGMLYDIGAFDPVAFGVVSLTLLGCAIVACLVPARRAASVDPMVALRDE
jgi:putative ABC transport system permease protein